ncbi:MAG TPA: hypothetical protein VHS53_07030, partial [Mucilaginibacter sp.]|nr:hypothetical protein [Mucilaginibacter sp.]
MKKFFCAGNIMVLLLFGFTDAEKGHLDVKADHGVNSKQFFELNVNKGEKLGNVFSRTISYKGEGFPEIAFRASGTGIYTVVDNNPGKAVFEGVFRYDGRPESKGTNIISDAGKTSMYNGKSSVNTDGSGLMFNSLIWGTPPAKIKTGDTWDVAIPQSWELGGAGTQKITVMEVDEKNHIVRLKREGSSEGFYDNDARQITITKDANPVKVAVTPGTSHWTGYTIFKNGLVISDELMVSRPVTLTAENLKFDAFE